MSHAYHFALQLDRLVRCLADHADQVEDQKEILRAMRDAVAQGEVTILTTREGLLVNGAAAVGPAGGLTQLRAQLQASGVQRLFLARDAAVADMLLAARALAGGRPWDGLELRTVRASATLTPRPTPIGIRFATPPDETHAVGGGRPSSAVPVATDYVLPQPASGRRLAAVATPHGATPAVSPTPAASAPPVPPAPTARARPSAELVAPIMTDEDVLGDAAILLRPTPTVVERVLSTEELVARVAEQYDLNAVNRLMEEVAARVERAVRDDDGKAAFETLLALVKQEQLVEQAEVRLAVGIALRRLLGPVVLNQVARLVPRLPDARDELLRVIARGGEPGSDALIEQLAAAESAADRRAFYNALLQLPVSEAALVHMLGDSRWFVVRNAAELIGDLELRGADAALVRTLRHEDERVVRSVLAALGRLATPGACEAIRVALRATAPEIRAAAAVAFGTTRAPDAVPALRDLLAGERDAEVRTAVATALGRVGTDEAVALLAGLAEKGRGLLRRNPTAQRVAAVHALAEAVSPRARSLLARLAGDDNAEVSAVAIRALKGGARLSAPGSRQQQ